MAHYLLFIGWTGESIFLWITYIFVKWALTRPQLSNDMSELYRDPKVNDNQYEVYVGVSKNLRAITSTAIVLTSWLITRYGYHLSIYLLIITVFKFVFVIFTLFNLLKPGIKVYRTLFAVPQITDIIAGIMHMPTVIQWYLTLVILTAVVAIPVKWCMVALNPETNMHECAFLIIPTGVASVLIWFLCKYYLDIYVQIEKI